MQSHSIPWSIAYAILAMFIVAAIYLISPHEPQKAGPCGPDGHLVYLHGSVPGNPVLSCGAN